MVYQKCKQYAIMYWRALTTMPSRVPRDGIVVLLFIATTFAGFGLGFIAGENHLYIKDGIRIESLASAQTVHSNNMKDVTKQNVRIQSKIRSTNYSVSSNKTVVASKNGSRYYLTSCTGAKRIHKENKIWFSSSAMAIAKGYTPAKHCIGL